MTNQKASSGNETWWRLLRWTTDSAAAERLAAHVLVHDGFKDIDPIHPRGGQDGSKDIKCTRDGTPWIVGVHFPGTVITFGKTKKKFEKDFLGVAANDAKGFVFFTNQELVESNRDALKKIAAGIDVEIYHLEKIVQRLDSPALFGTRLDFLGITMSHEEQVSFFQDLHGKFRAVLQDQLAHHFTKFTDTLDKLMKQSGSLAELSDSVKALRAEGAGSIGWSWRNTSNMLLDPLFMGAFDISPLGSRLDDAEHSLSRVRHQVNSLTGGPFQFGDWRSRTSTGSATIDDVAEAFATLAPVEEFLDRVIDKLNRIVRLRESIDFDVPESGDAE